MSVNFSCPISGQQRDSTTVRFVASSVFVISVVVLGLAQAVSIHSAIFITTFLTIDFIIRAFIKPKYSPLAIFARGIVSGLQLPKKMVDSAPKVFAARIGVIFSFITTVLFLGNYINAGSVVLLILIICAALEAFAGFCLGCWMYALLPRKLGMLLAKDFVK